MGHRLARPRRGRVRGRPAPARAPSGWATASAPGTRLAPAGAKIGQIGQIGTSEAFCVLLAGAALCVFNNEAPVRAQWLHGCWYIAGQRGRGLAGDLNVGRGHLCFCGPAWTRASGTLSTVIAGTKYAGTGILTVRASRLSPGTRVHLQYPYWVLLMYSPLPKGTPGYQWVPMGTLRVYMSTRVPG